MSSRLYIPVFASTLLLSAALLFSVQPMFSKMILPLLGGTPQVWNTAMLFFQVCLLGGYAYAHGTTKFLGARAQALVHLVLLGICIIALPFLIPEGTVPPTDGDPSLWQLTLMAVTVGGPFFVLAGSAPMLQRWFSMSNHPDADNPYFLYGASNLGSMASLLAYPVLIEPYLPLNEQAFTWMYGYFALIALMVISAVLVWKHTSFFNTRTLDSKAIVKSHAPTWRLRFYWILLAFIPSSLMLGVTTFVTTDIASVPLLWIMPLAIYVGTFILVFARKPKLSEGFITNIFEIGVILLIGQLIGLQLLMKVSALVMVGYHFALFFFAAMLCHTLLAKSKPHTSHLTEFYLLMSVGGALGGFFNAIIAPQAFIVPIEYGLVLVMAVFMRYSADPSQSFASFKAGIKNAYIKKGVDGWLNVTTLTATIIIIFAIFGFGIPNEKFILFCAFVVMMALFMIAKKRWAFGIMTVFLFSLFPLGFIWGQHQFEKIHFQARNFFGVMKVIDTNTDERILLHGTTNHGAQALIEQHRLTPLSYYSENSPISDLMKYYDQKSGTQNVGVIGLGVGVTSCFVKEGRHFDFFEIDPEIAYIAQNPEFFTYLSDCGSPYDIILGDGRLTINEKPDGNYDVLLVDAFSSDNIPVHIITQNAMEIYLNKLKPDGTIIINISNNYLDLEPVVTAIGEQIGVPVLGKVSNNGEIEGTKIEYYSTHFMALTKSESVIADLKARGWSDGMKRDGVKAWTDQYSNIVRVLGVQTTNKRFMDLHKELEATKAAEKAATEAE